LNFKKNFKLAFLAKLSIDLDYNGTHNSRLVTNQKTFVQIICLAITRVLMEQTNTYFSKDGIK